jgi:hypothetical protein
VRIPYQQKRMFGFVTFVYPETVKLILAKGNPHFICDARVLVKPYKEKGKVPDKYRHAATTFHFAIHAALFALRHHVMTVRSAATLQEAAAARREGGFLQRVGRQRPLRSAPAR